MYNTTYIISFKCFSKVKTNPHSTCILKLFNRKFWDLSVVDAKHWLTYDNSEQYYRKCVPLSSNTIKNSQLRFNGDPFSTGETFWVKVLYRRNCIAQQTKIWRKQNKTTKNKRRKIENDCFWSDIFNNTLTTTIMYCPFNIYGQPFFDPIDVNTDKTVSSEHSLQWVCYTQWYASMAWP